MTTVLSAYSIGLIISNLAAGWLAQVAPMSALFWASFVFFLLAAICIAFLPSKTQPRTAMPAVRYRDLMHFPAYRVMLALFTLVTIIIFIPWSFTALYARQGAGVSNLWIGILMAGLYLGSVLIGLSLGQLRRRFGSVSIVLTHHATSRVEAALLFGDRRRVHNFRGRQMGRESLQHKMLCRFQRAEYSRKLVETHAQPAHAGIHF